MAARTLRLGVTALVAMALVGPSAPPAQAKEDKPQNADLRGVAYNFGSANGSLLFLINPGAHPIRAIVAVRDSSGDLVGCGLETIDSGEQSVLYIKRSPKGATTDEGLLAVTVYGTDASAPLLSRLKRKAGLDGSLAQVDATSGELNGGMPLLQVNVPQVDLQTDVDACFGAGLAAPLTAEDNLVTSDLPLSWGATPQGSGASSTKATKRSKKG